MVSTEGADVVMIRESDVKSKVIAVVGLGYVGLPLAENFSKYFSVIGFDINQQKIDDLSKQEYAFQLSSDAAVLSDADIIILAVPTPITSSKEPDLSYIEKAAGTIGSQLKKGGIVVLESTVYPGVTEEVLGPILEKTSGLVCGRDFTLGYSPERVNPGDADHTIDKITKIVSGQDEETTDILAKLYGCITKVYVAEDIRTAESAKVIENIQRDLNIALVNELAIIFDKIGLDAQAVLRAAGTKWNFHSYTPGLVGGHCIPVDPYYLVYKAKLMGYHPQVILAGRAVNDSMPRYVFDLMLQSLNKARKSINGTKLLVMGLTFKENVGDTRENPVKEVIRLLKKHGAELYGFDPLLDDGEIQSFGITPVASIDDVSVDAVLMTVVHDEFKKLGLKDIKKVCKDPPILIDVRGYFSKDDVDGLGFNYQTL